MCVIIAKPAGQNLPDRETLLDCADANPDGFGFMYADKGKVHIRKGYWTVDRMLADLDKINAKDKAIVLHFRLATHGCVDEGCCHPFPVSIDYKTLRKAKVSCRLGVAHNGIFDIDCRKETVSDTMEFVLETAHSPRFYTMNAGRLQKLFNMALGGSKLAVMDGTGRLYLHGEGWKAENGVHFSNFLFRRALSGFGWRWWDRNRDKTPLLPDGQETDSADDPDEIELFCTVCGAAIDEDIDAFCPDCGGFVDEVAATPTKLKVGLA